MCTETIRFIPGIQGRIRLIINKAFLTLFRVKTLKEFLGCFFQILIYSNHTKHNIFHVFSRVNQPSNCPTPDPDPYCPR